ncbi:MAG: hypothetical protein GY765_16790 [bacterium]|nr:hypothetical protein [bacterium]
MRNSEREEMLLDFIESSPHPFTLAQFFKEAGIKKTKKSESEIREMLHATDYVVLDKKKFYPRHCFLPEIPFRIQPTEFEIQRGILISGHRLLPFLPFGVLSDDVVFLRNRIPIDTCHQSFKMEELQVFFSLMDLQKIPINNIEDILEEDADLEIKVFDMAEFYKERDFRLRDTLIARSVDFRESIFSLTHAPLSAHEADMFEAERYDRKFLSTLKKVISSELVFPSTEKQLLYTYFQLKDEEWRVPGSAVGPLLSKSPDITFSSLPNGRTMFHFSNQDFDDFDPYPDFAQYMEDEDAEVDLGSIDGIMQFLDNNNDSVVVRAVLLDLITEKKRFNFAKVENYLFSRLDKPYMATEIRNLLKFLVQQEFKRLKKEFNPHFAYLPITTARKKILETLLYISEFLRELDSRGTRIDMLPKNEMLHLMELERALSEVLVELETVQLEEQDKSSEIHRILKMVNKVCSELPMVFMVIESKIKA